MTKKITAEQLQDLLPSWTCDWDYSESEQAEKAFGLVWDEDKFKNDPVYKAQYETIWKAYPVKNVIGKPISFIRDGKLFLSNEEQHNQNMGVFDSYNELKRPDEIAPELLAWAEKLGTYFEAENMACIVINPEDVDPIKFRKLAKEAK